METNKIVNVLKKNDIFVESFSEADDLVDASIDLNIPKRKVHIQIDEYQPNQGLIVYEKVTVKGKVLFKQIGAFRISKAGMLKMISFLKNLGEN